jgi:hypothetical protein
MVIRTQEPLLPAGAGIDDVLVPLVGLTVLRATFGAPELTLGTAAFPEGALQNGVNAVVPT